MEKLADREKPMRLSQVIELYELKYNVKVISLEEYRTSLQSRVAKVYAEFAVARKATLILDHFLVGFPASLKAVVLQANSKTIDDAMNSVRIAEATLK